MRDKSSTDTRQDETTPPDVYREWLGLQNPMPSYYELLGLPALAADASTVMHAGRHVKRKLRQYQIGVYREQALRLLGEVGNAVSVLTNPEKKRAYDHELMVRWRATIEELYQAHCEGEERSPAVLEAWLTACRVRGVPVTRLMPLIVRVLCAQTGEWPAHGEHDLSLPAALWIYRDVVVLGRCLCLAVLEKRVRAVKRTQKALRISEGLALLVGEDVSQGLHVFAQSRLVEQARTHPDLVVLRLVRRVRRLGGHLERRSKVLGAVVLLLGLKRHHLPPIIARMDELPVDLPLERRVAVVARRKWWAARKRLGRARQWLAGRPQILLGVGIGAGMVALVLAILIVLGVWRPWRIAPQEPAPLPFVETSEPGHPAADAVGPGTGKPGADAPKVSENGSEPSPSQKEAWEEFIKKYPVDKPPEEPNGGADGSAATSSS